MLDEPTSALDSASEKEIVAAIRELHGTITIVIVSHRRSTVEYADRSVALDKGRIAVEHSIL
jgi:ABC-type bacteriocin/lantibiotic exporter with double-glycine peptidase domain